MLVTIPLLCAVLSLGVVGVSFASHDYGPGHRATGKPSLQRIKHVFVIMLENTDWSAVKGSSSAPYINHTLLSRYSHAENYHTKHPSLPNYTTLEAGADLGQTSGTYLPTDHSLRTHAHLTHLLQRQGYNWKYYGESLPGDGSRCNLSSGETPYSEDHNPFVYFQDVSAIAAPNGFGTPSEKSSYCRTHERPFKELAPDLARNHVPNYSFIVPNDWDNGDKYPPGVTCLLCRADAFLSKVVPAIQHSAAYKSSVIFIVWDEASAGSENPSGLIVVSPYARKGYAGNVAYSHASTLRTIEEIFHLKPYLRAAATATDLSDLFKPHTL